MATEKGNTEQNTSPEELMPESEGESDLDNTLTVNPLYSLATSMSDDLSPGRQRTSVLADQVQNESARTLVSVTNTNTDDTTSDTQSSDVSKAGFSSSGSFPSLSALQISKPPQSSAASEDQQQAALVKVQPPPVRLIRAPSSAKPATNIPQVDCPEKIVSSLKLDVFGMPN